MSTTRADARAGGGAHDRLRALDVDAHQQRRVLRAVRVDAGHVVGERAALPSRAASASSSSTSPRTGSAPRAADDSTADGRSARAPRTSSPRRHQVPAQRAADEAAAACQEDAASRGRRARARRRAACPAWSSRPATRGTSRTRSMTSVRCSPVRAADRRPEGHAHRAPRAPRRRAVIHPRPTGIVVVGAVDVDGHDRHAVHARRSPRRRSAAARRRRRASACPRRTPRGSSPRSSTRSSIVSPGSGVSPLRATGTVLKASETSEREPGARVEVVGGRGHRGPSPPAPRQRAQQQRRVHVAGVVGDEHHRPLERGEVLVPADRAPRVERDQRPEDPLRIASRASARRHAARPRDVVPHTIFPGLRLRPGSTPSNSAAQHRGPRRGDVLLQPLGVLGADGVVVRERRAVVDERLLDAPTSRACTAPAARRASPARTRT